MTTAIVKVPAIDTELRDLIDSRWAKNTQLRYNVGWRQFAEWCQAHGVDALPSDPETVVQFLTEQSQLVKHLSRIQASYGAIRWVHVRSNLPSPTSDDRVRLVMSAVKKKLGLRNEGKSPLFGDALLKTIKAIDRKTLTGKRDAALILVGFWLALRRDSIRHLRAEPASLKVAAHGYSIFLDKSKTDQDAKGVWFHLERRPKSVLCPVRALGEWLKSSGLRDGPIFVKVAAADHLWPRPLSGQAIARIIKARLAAAGLDPVNYSGHSMRSGFVTSAMEEGVPTAAIRDITGHTSDAMLMRYWRHFGSPSKQSPSSKIRLTGENL